jgi:hypothetical protein
MQAMTIVVASAIKPIKDRLILREDEHLYPVGKFS